MAKNFLFTDTQLSADGSRVVQSNTILSEPRQDNSNIPKVKLKALAQLFYKLVDTENGSVVKDQYLVRKGKSLQVWVEQQHMLELEDFFESGSEIHSAQSEPVYVVQIGSAESPAWGLITPQSESQYLANDTYMVWTPGVQVERLADPVAFGVNPVLISGLFNSALISAGTVVAGVAAYSNFESASKSTTTDSNATLTGTVSLGPLKTSNLKITAYKADGTLWHEANVNNDGNYTLDLKGYTGALTLKLSGTATYINESGGTATYDASVTVIRAVVAGGSGNISAHLNPLTEIAAQKIVGTDSNGKPTIASVSSIATVNKSVAKLFLGDASDITQIAADTTTDGGNTSNALGKFLAIIAAAEQMNGLTTAQVISKIAKGISADGTGFSAVGSDAIETKTLLQSATAQAVGNSSLPSEDSRLLLKHILLDTSANALPQVMITSDKGVLGKDSTSTVSFTFNQDPGHSFDLSDITVSGGVLSQLSVSAGDSSLYTATFTPAQGATSASFSVAANQFKTAGTNTDNIASDTLKLVVDTDLPVAPVDRVSFSADTGSSSTDLVTQTATQTLSGSLNAELAYGEKVLVSLDDGNHWAEATTSGTQWTLAEQTLSTSHSTIRVKVTDLAGNESSVINKIYHLDNTKPATPDAALTTDSSNGMSSSYATDSLIVTEGQAPTLTTSMLGITDPDTSNANLKITATVQTNGNFTLNGSFATAFTLDDVANSRVKFVHDGSEQAPQIRLKVTDLGNVATATDVPVTVSFTNTPDPTVVQTPSFAISEGGSLLLNTSQIPVADPDTSAECVAGRDLDSLAANVQRHRQR